MSLSGALAVGLSGLQASTTAVQIISGNISNAQTEGYTQKSVSLAPVTTGTSLGGVDVTGYTRITNSVLSATLNNATSSSSYLSTQNGYMAQVQSLLDSTSNPPALSADLSAFQAAWTVYAGDPSDTTLEKNIVSTGQALANTVSEIAIQTSILKTNVGNDLVTSVTALNAALAKVQDLNVKISAALANRQPTVDLQDERDVAINEISKYTSVTIMERSNGQVSIYSPGGTAMLDQESRSFSVASDGHSILNDSGFDVTNALIGGSLQAQTDFLSPTATTANGIGVVVKLESQLRNFANMFVATTAGGGSFADIYNAAATGTGEQAADFFTANINADGLPDLTSFAINDNLVNGTTSVKSDSAVAINDAFSATNAAITTTYDSGLGVYVYTTSSTFSAAGLTTQSQTYSGIATAILSGFQQAANTIKSQYATASTQQAYYKSSLSAQTGVDTDGELVNLTNWQNSYAASAHVISTIQSMMTVLENMVQT